MSHFIQIHFGLYCERSADVNCTLPDHFWPAVSEQSYNALIKIRNDPERGSVLEGNLTQVPCMMKENFQREFKIYEICKFLKNIKDNRDSFLKLKKFSKPSPVIFPTDEEYNSIFSNANETVKQQGYFYTKNLKESYAFVPLCQFGKNLSSFTLENCNLFKRSFTNRGIGYTFNNIKMKDLYKDRVGEQFFFNNDQQPVMMKTASANDALIVMIDANAEEVDRYLSTISENNPTGDLTLKPNEVQVVLHSSSEPANVMSKSFEIPLGHSTTVFITPRAREIDESAKDLTEQQRNCRLNEDTDQMNIFNVYSKEACLYECKMLKAVKHCGCVPWDFPSTFLSNKVKLMHFNNSNLLIFYRKTIPPFVIFLAMFALKRPWKK